MSEQQQSADTHYPFDTHYQRYKFLKFNYNTREWVFQHWMPVDWRPPLPPPPPPPQSAAPPSKPVDHSRKDSASAPIAYSSSATSTPATASLPYAVSYSNFPPNSYGSSSAIQQPNQQSHWPIQNPNPGPQLVSYPGSSTFPPQNLPPNAYSVQASGHRGPMPKGKGNRVFGTYSPSSNTLHYELVDTSYFVRSKPFFFEGRVFSVIMNETAGANSTDKITDYNSSNSINCVKYKDNYVYTNVRRFIVVRQKREFCYACPIFTYSGKATTKRGVRASEHGIAHSWGQKPQLLPGEGGITKPDIPVVMATGVSDLHAASRIYYGIIHPIQYNVKVKEIGYVPPVQVPVLIGNWKAEDDSDTEQESGVTANAEIPEDDEENNDDNGNNSHYTEGGADDGSNEAQGDINELSNDFSKATIHGQQ